ncbi:MAG: choice-of-anchor D domain-containing protein, partial [Xanthobacteraceae bacterium]
EIDVEWSSAAAPSAAIVLASCANSVTFGGFIAIENLLSAEGTPPAIVSISYGESEAELGAAGNAFINSLYQEAVAAGVSLFVSSGDEGAASSDSDKTVATHGIAVSGFASTPYDVAVGGTDFGDTFAGVNSSYWSTANGTADESALSYIPEIPWNNSCASELISSFLGYSAAYGSSGFCNSSIGTGDFLTTTSGSGGPSGCASGAPSSEGVVGASCAGYAKPGWQRVVGNPSDGVRDIPDVSMFAANGVWDHYYVVCFSDTNRGGVSCTGVPDTWAGFGGTSVSSPIMAAIQALANQRSQQRQGNPNPTYYSIAATEYGASGDSACNSSLGNAVAGSCVFYDVTQGDMDVNCTGSNNCYTPSGSNGVLSTLSSAFSPAYPAATGWDFATGIGTVNAFNLVMSFPAGSPTPTPTATPTGTATSTPTPTATVTPVAEKLSISATIIHFGKVVVDATSKPKKITITNRKRKRALPVIVMGQESSVPGSFIVDDQCQTTLLPGEHCVLTIEFAPTTIGKQSATLMINDNAEKDPQRVTLSGTGKAAPAR